MSGNAPILYGRNEVKLQGDLLGAFYQYTFQDMDYYGLDVELIKPDGKENLLPVQATTEQFARMGIHLDEEARARYIDINKPVKITGTLRSMKYEKEGNKKAVYVKARRIDFIEGDWSYENEVELEGTILRLFDSRITETGREVRDFLISVRRYPDRECYIYIVTMGDAAKAVNTLKVGDIVQLNGVFVHREWFQKETGDKKATNEVIAFGIKLA